MPGERVRTMDQGCVKAAAGGRRTESRQAVTASSYADRRDQAHPCFSSTKHPPQHTWAPNPKPEISGGVYPRPSAPSTTDWRPALEETRQFPNQLARCRGRRGLRAPPAIRAAPARAGAGPGARR